MNKVGCALPLAHQTMSGGLPFHAVATAITRAHSEAVVTSALIPWNRCFSGDLAAFYVPGVSWDLGKEHATEGLSYCYLGDAPIQLLGVPGHDDDASSLLGQLTRRAKTKTPRASGNQDGLFLVSTLLLRRSMGRGELTRPSTGNSFDQKPISRWSLTARLSVLLRFNCRLVGRITKSKLTAPPTFTND